MAKPKVKAVKWAIGADEPEDLQEFLSNDDLIAKHTNKKTQEVAWPGKGPFRFKVVNVKIREIKTGDNAGKDRVAPMLVLDEPKGSKATGWNGYAVFDGFNVTEQGAPYLKRFLRALGLEWKDFVGKSKQDDQDPPHLVQIGTVKFEGAKPVHLMATVRVKDPDDYNQDEHMEIGRYLPADEDEPEDEPEDEEEEDEESFEAEDEEEDEDDDEEDDEEDEDEDEEDEEDDDEDEDEEDEDEEDEDDAEEELREELGGMTKAALEKRAQRTARKFKGDPSTIPNKKAGIIDWIVEAELGEPPF
jgi:hypothetical protein